jgi:EmrB/QacA subfamily drug resistance transporter
MPAAPPPLPPPTPVLTARRRQVILAAMCVALVAVVASVSGLNVAQQQLAVDLGASQNMLLWIINGYTMVLAGLLLPIGAIGDRWGRKPVLLAGLVVFAGANIAASLAGSASAMLVARLVAGAGAAMIMPVTLSVITSSFPEEERARAVGVWAGFAGAGGILGLFFSSAMVDWFSWPWLFALPVVLCAVSLVLSVLAVVNTKDEEHHAFDIGGSLLSAVGIAGLILAIHEGPEHGWTEPLTLAGLVVGLGGVVGFVAWELRREHPLLEVRLFRNRSLTMGSLNLMIVFGVMFGMFLVLVQYLQAVLGFSALRASGSLLPMALLMMTLSGIVPRIIERIGVRTTLMIGTSFIGLGFVALSAFASTDGGYPSVLTGLLLLGVGVGFAMTPSTIAITDSLPPEKQGVASALNDTVREVGGALGVALLGSVLNSGYRGGIGDVAATLPESAREPVEKGIGSALGAAPTLGDQGGVVIAAARTAFLDGFRLSMAVAAGLAALGVVLLVVLAPRSTGRRSAPAVTAEPAPASA